MEQNNQITCQLVGLKAKSKKEMYRLLVSDAHIYLPPIKEANYLYIRQILTGKKVGKTDAICKTFLVYKELRFKANSGATDKTSKCKKCTFIS